MLRLPGRAAGSVRPLLSTSFRSNLRTQCLAQRARALATTSTGKEQSVRHQHAVSNPTLANIEKRWEEMPPQEQAEIWMALRDRMTVDWHQLTMQEKKASYWIAFGPHGPRALDPPGTGWKIFRSVVYALIASLSLFAFTRLFAGPPPKTMTREWQEATNEYMKRQKMEPITGISAEDYRGKGAIQSKSAGKSLDEMQEEDED